MFSALRLVATVVVTLMIVLSCGRVFSMDNGIFGASNDILATAADLPTQSQVGSIRTVELSNDLFDCEDPTAQVYRTFYTSYVLRSGRVYSRLGLGNCGIAGGIFQGRLARLAANRPRVIRRTLGWVFR